MSTQHTGDTAYNDGKERLAVETREESEEWQGDGRGGEGRGGLTGDGDVAAAAVASERVSDGSECSSHGVREQGDLVQLVGSGGRMSGRWEAKVKNGGEG